MLDLFLQSFTQHAHGNQFNTYQNSRVNTLFKKVIQNKTITTTAES